MKKFFKILLIVIMLVIIALISIPLFFKSEIMLKVKQEVNKSVNAKVDWKDFSLSLISGFPDLKVSMKDVSVVGINKFEGDTLMSLERFSAKINLFSIFSDNIKVRSILLNKPIVNAIISADSSVNWDIVVPSSAQELEEELADTSSQAMVIQLRNFEIRDGKINYVDKLDNMSANFTGLNLKLKGDFSEDFSTLDLTSDIASFTFTMDGFQYIKNATMDITSLIEADFVKYNFAFSDNEIKLNDLKMGMEGSFGMPNDTDITMDIRFFGKDTEFKSILSMVPAVYMKDFARVKSGGKFLIDGTAKGVYNDKEMPKVDVAIQVIDGYFSYPDLPKSVNNINIDSKIFYDGVNEDNSKIDVNKFHLEMAGNPFDMNLHIITPMSDMQMNGALKGRIDLGSVADVIPLAETKLAGIINMDIDFMGKMSDIEKENYEAFKADGSLEASGVVMEGKDIPVAVSVSGVTMKFSPKFVNLQTFDAKLGNSDIHLDGTLENFIPYVFKNEMIRGTLNFNSNYLNISELMAAMDTDGEEESIDTTALKVIEVPKNIDLTLNSGIGRILYDKLEMNNVKGKVMVKGGKVLLDNLSMNLLEGSMIMSGEYNSLDIKIPMVSYRLDIKEIDIPSAFNAFNTVEKLAPIAKSMIGKISVKLDFNSILDSAMYPVMKSINGSGTLNTNEVEIVKSETFNRIAQALKNDRFKDVKISDIKAFFDIKNGRIIIKPFDTKIASSIVTIGGDHGIDQTMNYSMIFSIPRKEFGAAANDVYENLAAQAASLGFDIKQSENVNINLKITGTFDDPKIGLDVKQSMAQAKTEVIQAVQEKVMEELQKVKADVNEKANAEIDRIMMEAEEQAAGIKAAAKEAGEKLVGEAQLQGNNLVREAGSNMLKKAVAEKAAAELVKNANQKADALNKEAETKANALLQEAQKKADALKK
jgi:uncharacterized protein involved in outer membrane biogenesis